MIKIKIIFLTIHKIHCSILAEDAIKAAVEDYRSKHPELAADKATGTHA